MKRIFISMFQLMLSGLLIAQPSGDAILDRIDENMSAESRHVISKMVIHGVRNDRTIESETWSVGDEKSYTEYLAPARERGTKMLKLDDKLWIYSPGTDRTIQLSGHMLRQSVMGSDLSYEDMMDDPNLRNKYDAVVTGNDQLNGTDCWVVELYANVADVAYQTRKIWVDKQKYLPLKEELFAKSGTLLKKTEMLDIRKIEGRWYPGKIVFKDMLKKGDGTEFIVEKIEFNVDVPEHLLSKAALR
ncbi:MAG TPA: outer membrane lipoprotein-sorting protein [Bacteroidales bacterium]|nr:outer membrane lipoprotein-sorting protein [Bacteroidales bacterium]